MKKFFLFTVVLILFSSFLVGENDSNYLKKLDSNELNADLESTKKHVFKLASWTDPLTPPKTRNKCVKEFKTKKPWPLKGWIKTCSGWKLEKQFMERELNLVVNFDALFDLKELQAHFTKCMARAAVSGAIDAYVTGGITTVETIKGVCSSCLKESLGNNLVGVFVESKSSWSAWK
jgi:hypothetical protein